ncbi:thioesterase family protein [Rhodoglobus aureus]|uniref:Thioesterase family protein n=1 Tax=Rhodoglobus aureus TaxID=191497 RepID=A0ABN1VIM5_9MICO
MNLIFRTIFHRILSPRRSPLGVRDVGSMSFRVLPTDIDVLRHMNNGVYFSIMDLGRMDLLIRAGSWKHLTAKGYYPVMANETISFRKSLDLWKKFDLETRVVGYDEKAVFVEQRFVVDGQIYAQAMTRARFLKKSGGTVSVAELLETIGWDAPAPAMPDWVQEWADHVALPVSRADAPSIWE